jgi:hypothetical protein
VRRRDDYGELLFSGQVIRLRGDIEDPGEWRAAIRKKARADRIKIRTGETGDRIWALVNGPLSSELLLEGRQFFVFADRALEEARSRSHEVRVALRDGEEAVIKCERCGTLGYLDAAESMAGGPILEKNCHGEEAPDPSEAG